METQPHPFLEILGVPKLILPYKTINLRCTQYECLFLLLGIEEELSKAELRVIWSNDDSLQTAFINLRSFQQSCGLSPITGLLNKATPFIHLFLESDINSFRKAVLNGDTVAALLTLNDKPLFKGFDFNKSTIPVELELRFRFIKTQFTNRVNIFLTQALEDKSLSSVLKRKAEYLLSIYAQVN